MFGCRSLEILEIVLFRTFQTLQKNDVKLELQKSRKTRSDSKTNSKVWLKVWNAWPYYAMIRGRKIMLYPTSDRV